MPRPRKDGQPSTQPTRIGKPRPTSKGGTYKVRAYGPTSTNPHGRVTYRIPETDRPTSAVIADGESLDDLFDQIERALDQNVALGPTTSAETAQAVVRNMRSLADLYIERLEDDNCDPSYVNGRRSLLRKWVLPVIGDTLVAEWSAQHSRKVINGMRASNDVKSQQRVDDLRSTLSGLRETAHMKRIGGRWLSRDEDPLEGVKTAPRSEIEGAHANYVEEQFRPRRKLVRTAIEASGHVKNVWWWMPTIISIAAFCALRLSEQLALRAIDIDFENREIDVNGRWKVEPKAAVKGEPRRRWRQPSTKNDKRRTTPYLGSQHDDLLVLARRAFGLPEDTLETIVIATSKAERARRAKLHHKGEWRNVEVDDHDEVWLFPGADGLPPNKESFNTTWRRVRDAVEWPTFIPYKNLRHHAAMHWRKKGFRWETIAAWDGHDEQTLKKYYVVRTTNSTKKARKKLDLL